MKQSNEETNPKATPEKLSCENLTMLGNLKENYCPNCGAILMKSARGMFCQFCYEKK